MTEEEQHSLDTVDASGIHEEDPKTKIGQTAIMFNLAQKKFDVKKMLKSDALPSAEKEDISAGNHVGDELTIRVMKIVISILRTKGQMNRNKKIRKMA